MFPSSSVAQALFAPPWYLAMAGTLHSCGYLVTAPYASLWESHVGSRLGDFRAIISILIDEFCFDEDVAKTLMNDWETRGERTWPESESDIYIALSVSSFGERKTPSDLPEKRALVRSAATRQLSMLLEAALVAKYAAEKKASKRVDESALSDVLGHALKIAGGVLIPRGELVRATAREWLDDTPWTIRGFEDSFQQTIRDLMQACAGRE